MNTSWETKLSNQGITHMMTRKHTEPAGHIWKLKALEQA